MTGYICNGSMTVEERNNKMQTAIKLFRTGYKVSKIVDIIGCDRSTIYKWLRCNNIKVGECKYPVELVDQIADLYKTKTRGEIAKELGIDYPVVQYIINANYIRKNEVIA